jgi:hypothetical protein
MELELRRLMPAFLALTIISLCSPIAWGNICDRYPVISSTRADGTEVGVYLTEEQLKRAPNWPDQSTEPPLAVSKAVTIALRWAKVAYVRYDDVQIGEIWLRETECFGRRYWYYLFRLAPVIDGNDVLESGHWVAVLLDGTVVGPVHSKKAPPTTPKGSALPSTSEL